MPVMTDMERFIAILVAAIVTTPLKIFRYYHDASRASITPAEMVDG